MSPTIDVPYDLTPLNELPEGTPYEQFTAAFIELIEAAEARKLIEEGL
jgi:hypothetical protein